MIYTTVVIPCASLVDVAAGVRSGSNSSSNDQSFDRLCVYIKRAGFITPVILRLEGLLESIPMFESLESVLKLLAKIAPCHVSGLVVPEDDDRIDVVEIESFYIRLLDAGIQSVSFDITAATSHLPSPNTIKFISQFPKTRAGVCLSGMVTLDSIVAVAGGYKDIVSSSMGGAIGPYFAENVSPGARG